MKIKLSDYIKKIEDAIEKKKIDSKLIEEILIFIGFFQHERLVHFIVTFFTGISAILFLFMALYFETIPILLLFLITIVIFAFYIKHYYYLENGVQKLYDLYYDATKINNEK